MGALSGEPWRGLAKIKIADAGGEVHYTVSIADVDPLTATGDQATWEGDAGSSFTLRFEWATSGTPVFEYATRFRVDFFRSDDTSFNNVWDWTGIGGSSGSATRTVHFDDDPLNATLAGLRRAGIVRVKLFVERIDPDTQLVVWSANSEGSSGPAGATTDYARGYLRSRCTAGSIVVNKSSITGSDYTETFAAGDTTYNRFKLDCHTYVAKSIKLVHRQVKAGTPTDAREETGAASTSDTRDFTWGESVRGLTGRGRINDDYDHGATAVAVRAVLPADEAFGDTELVWSDSLPSGWTRVDDSTIEYASKFVADPRLTTTFLLQNNDSAWGTGPSTKNVSSGRRPAGDIGLLAVRLTNARSEGMNDLAWTEKLWDSNNLVGSEGSPAKSRTTSSSTTQGGEAGWSDGSTVGLVWDNASPGGSWTHKVVVTTTDLSASGLISEPTRTLKLQSSDPSKRVLIATYDPDAPEDYWFPGQKLRVEATVANGHTKVAPDSSTAYCSVIRFTGTGTIEYFTTSDTWSTGDVFDKHAMTVSGTDSKLVFKEFSTAQTTTFDDEDLWVVVSLDVGDVTYSDWHKVPSLKNKAITTGKIADYAITPKKVVASVTGSLTEYKRESSEEWRTNLGSLYVRDESRLKTKGKVVGSEYRDAFKITYNGIEYTEGTGVDAKKLYDVDDNQVGVISSETTTDATWIIGENEDGTTTGLTAVPPGDEGMYTLVIVVNDDATATTSVVVDRTAPNIADAALVDPDGDQGLKGESSTNPIVSDDLVQVDWTATDDSSGVAFEGVDASSVGGSTFETRDTPITTAFDAPQLESVTVVVTAIDLAGNSSTANVTVWRSP